MIASPLTPRTPTAPRDPSIGGLDYSSFVQSTPSITSTPVVPSSEFWSTSIDSPTKYNINDIIARDGKLYAGDVELGPSSLIDYATGERQYAGEGGDGALVTKSIPLWAIEDFNNYNYREPTYSNDEYSTLIQQPANLSGVTNPYYTKNPTLSMFTSTGGNRDYLYGTYGQGGLNFDDDSGLGAGGDFLQAWKGGDIWIGGGKGGRAEMTADRTKYVQNVLHQAFPYRTKDELDAAAYAALKKHSSENGGDTYHYGMNANDIVREIGSQLGGLPSNVESYLSSTDEKMTQMGRDMVSAAHQADDADDFSLMQVAPLAMMFIPGMQGLATTIGTSLGATGAAATAIGQGIISGGLNLLQTGDLGSALKAGTLGGFGSYAGDFVGGLDSLKGLDPTVLKAIQGATQGFVSSGFNPQGALSGGLTGGLGQYAASNLPSDMRWLARPLASAGSQLMLNGKVDPYKLANSLAQSIRTPTSPK